MPVIRSDVAAVVLAAGLSSRMGQFKPLLDIGGQTIIERVIATCRAAGVEPLVVTGHEAGRLEPVLERLGVCRVVNPRYHQEMFTSVKTGAAAIDGKVEAFFLYPGDMPFVRPGTLAQIMKARRKSSADMVRPLFRERGGHPVLVSATRIPSIMSFRGEGGLRNLVRKQAWQVLDTECGDSGILTDLDTPEDYERALREHEPLPPAGRPSTGR
jgi:CTP:molybdopterin cytidylyltransferase MocA